MGWQLLIVALIVVVAAVYLLRATWRAWSGRKGCGGGCCGSKEATQTEAGKLISSEQMLSRLRPQRRATDDPQQF